MPVEVTHSEPCLVDIEKGIAQSKCDEKELYWLLLLSTPMQKLIGIIEFLVL